MGSTFIHGAAIETGWKEGSLNLSELIFRCVSRAVAASGVAIERIGSVVLAGHDVVDGRSLSSMVTAPAAGAYLRDEIRLAEDGLAAASLAGARVASGEFKFSIVAGWGRASEGDYAHTSRFAFDPATQQPFGLDEFALSSLRLSAWLAEYGDRPAARRHAVDVRDQRAARNPRSVGNTPRPAVNFPLYAAEAPRFADIVAAAIVGQPESAVRVAGFGHSAGSATTRDTLLAMQPLRDAVARAHADAGTSAGEIDLYQLSGAMLPDEALALEALGVAEAGCGFDAYADMPNVNSSGGGASGWCFPAMGLLNFVEAYFQLTGQAGGAQLADTPRHALVTGMSPLGGQIAHAAILAAS